MENKREKKKYGFLFAGILVIAAVYMGLSVYFMDRFFPRTMINGQDFSMSTPAEAEKWVLAHQEPIVITLISRNGTEELNVNEFGGSFELGHEIQQIKRMQNGFEWPRFIWAQDNWEVKPELVINEKEFEAGLLKLACMEAQTEPQNAELVFSEYGFRVRKEKQGNLIKQDILAKAVKDAFANGGGSVDLEVLGAYEEPEICADSDEIQNVVKQLLPIFSAQVTYEIGEKPVVIDAKQLQEWVAVKNGKVSLEEDKILAFVDELADIYDKESTKRVFYSTLQGRKVLTDKKHKWVIDREKEKEALLACIKEGGTISREPYYKVPSGSYMGSEFGESYVEVDLSAQHMWIYRDGKAVVETDVVTGNVRAGNQTPEIIGFIYKMQRNRTLRGPGYASFVRYWAPFYKGYGLHDANWRSAFGGNIYTYDGSHGCVNIPPAVMPQVYENLELGMPVITYY